MLDNLNRRRCSSQKAATRDVSERCANQVSQDSAKGTEKRKAYLERVRRTDSLETKGTFGESLILHVGGIIHAKADMAAPCRRSSVRRIVHIGLQRVKCDASGGAKGARG